MKAMVYSTDGDSDFFDILAVVSQVDTLASFIYIICLDYVVGTSIDIIKDNSLTLKKEKSSQYPAVTITDADDADDLALLENTPMQTKLLQDNLASSSLHMTSQYV